jgi:hypothetical protein
MAILRESKKNYLAKPSPLTWKVVCDEDSLITLIFDIAYKIIDIYHY